MTANEIPVGASFVGVVDREDWRARWNAGQPFPGELVRVSLIVPGESPESYLKDLLKLHANHLPTASSAQIHSRLFLWVVGVRDKRSSKVRLIEWDVRRDLTHLEEIHVLFRAKDLDAVADRLETLEGRKVPYLG